MADLLILANESSGVFQLGILIGVVVLTVEVRNLKSWVRSLDEQIKEMK